MRIGFLNNQIDNRGTGNAVFDYAHYNEEILGNKSIILTFPSSFGHDQQSIDRYVDRFDQIFDATNEATYERIDVLYHIKSGTEDGFRPPKGIPYLAHAVFDVAPHGDKYATISEWMGTKYNIPFVPHIVQLPDVKENYRQILRIPDNATVLGRHGGYDTFDISWAWDAIEAALSSRPDLYFIFVNTQPHLRHDRIFYYPATSNPGAKRAFINTCDGMMHARTRGETFGIAVGEFSHLGKPIITYGESGEKAHLHELKGTAITYTDVSSLTDTLFLFDRNISYHPFYTKYTPENVMEKFKEVFLDENSGN